MQDKAKQVIADSKKLKQLFELESKNIVESHFKQPITNIVKSLKEEEMMGDEKKLKEEEAEEKEVDLDPTIEAEQSMDDELTLETEMTDDLKEYEDLMGADAGMSTEEDELEEEYEVDLNEFEGEENTQLTSKENSVPPETLKDESVSETEETKMEEAEEEKKEAPVSESVKKLKTLVKIRENELKKKNKEIFELKKKFNEASVNLKEATRTAMFNQYYKSTLNLPGLSTKQKSKITDQFDNAVTINEAKAIYEAYKVMITNQSSKKIERMLGNKRQTYNAVFNPKVNESTETKTPLMECASVFKKFTQK